MRDENKTKDQLINELEELRQRISELESLATLNEELEEKLQQRTDDLGKRVKELNCLYNISRFIERPGVSLIEISQGVVNLIPSTYQYPQIICSRIILGDQQFQSENFKETRWMQSSDIFVHEDRVGAVEVCYLEERSKSNEWPFLQEERDLINAIAERLGRTIERKQAEEALKRSEEKYYNLIEFANVGIIVAEDDKIAQVNKQAEEIYGYTKGELIGQSPRILTPEKYSKHHGEILNEFLRSGKISKMIFEEEGIKKDGTLFPIEISFSLSQAGEDTTIAVVRDITERKKVEEALKKSEEKYHNLIELASDAIICMNKEGIITTFNKRAEEMLGYSRDETLGKSVILLSPPRDREREKKSLERLKTSNELGIIGKALEGVGLKKDGQEIPVESSVFALETHGEYILTSIIRDISERKKAEEERKRLLDELKDKNKELEQIVYVASHDLRSPLVNVQGFSRELEQALTKVCLVLRSNDVPTKIKEELATFLDEDIPDALKYILTSISKMDSLLSGLLRLSRLGRAALSKKHLDMDKLISDIASAFEYQIKKTGITLQIDPLPSCCGDETQINQVISNLLDNALKYLDHNRPGVIRISGKAENGQVIYSIEDNGIGIAAEHQDKIYEIFHRLNPAGTPGEGLGLTIVRLILDRHSGKIWVASEPGKGSTFFVSLPTI